MMCYRDMTFCSSNCTNSACVRHWDYANLQAARRWWQGDNPPVAFTDFSPTCVEYSNENKSG